MTSHALVKCISLLERIFRQGLDGRLLSALVCFVFGYARSHWSFKTVVILSIHDVMKVCFVFGIFIDPDLIWTQICPELLVCHVILVSPLESEEGHSENAKFASLRTDGR
jgi:hypothetical protein